MRSILRQNGENSHSVLDQRRGVASAFSRLPGDGACLASGFTWIRTKAKRGARFAQAKASAAGPRTQPTRALPIAILGAGHGGLALAGYLSQHGHRVALWNRSPARIAPVAALGGIHLRLPGASAAITRVDIATETIATALSGARLVLVTVPASAHCDIARASAPHLRDGQIVLLLPGRTGGALEFRRVLHEAGCRARILLGETETFPLTARSVGPAAAVVHSVKKEVWAAALPATATTELVAAAQPILPMLFAAGSVLHTGFANVGAILHPIITLLNADRIERGDSFDFYAEGVTAPVADTLAAADAERLRIARAYCVATYSLPAWIAVAYGHHADTMHAAVAGNPAYAGIKAPVTLEHRYLLEDVPTGLIPMIELANAAGLAAPTLSNLLARARIVLGRELSQRSRTLGVLGLQGFSPAAIRALVEQGSAPSTRRMWAGMRLFNTNSACMNGQYTNPKRQRGTNRCPSLTLRIRVPESCTAIPKDERG